MDGPPSREAHGHRVGVVVECVFCHQRGEATGVEQMEALTCTRCGAVTVAAHVDPWVQDGRLRPTG